MKGSVWETPKEASPPPPPHAHKALPEEPASSLHQTAKKGTGLPLTADAAAARIAGTSPLQGPLG